MGFGVWGLGLRVWGLGLRVKGLGVSGFGGEGLGSGVRVWDLGGSGLGGFLVWGVQNSGILGPLLLFRCVGLLSFGSLDFTF